MIVRIEDDNVPATEIVAVVSLRRIAGDRPVVLEVPVRVSAGIFVIAWRGTCSRLLTSPGWLIALLVLLDRPVFVGVVPCREHHHLAGGVGDHLVQEVRGQRVVLLCAGRNVARPNEYRVVRFGCAYRRGRKLPLLAVACITTGKNRRDSPVHRRAERDNGNEGK